MNNTISQGTNYDPPPPDTEQQVATMYSEYNRKVQISITPSLKKRRNYCIQVRNRTLTPARKKQNK